MVPESMFRLYYNTTVHTQTDLTVCVYLTLCLENSDITVTPQYCCPTEILFKIAAPRKILYTCTYIFNFMVKVSYENKIEMSPGM